MPELPEVETIRKDLNDALLGLKIKQVIVLLPKSVRGDIDIFRRILKGSSFENIERTGKLLRFKIANQDKYLLVHLKMTGQLIYDHRDGVLAGGHSLSKDEAYSTDRHTRVCLEFVDGSRLYFNDMRQFGYMQIIETCELPPVLARFGPEPLSKDFTVAYLQSKLRKKSIAVKASLLDQALVAGIGNIYADEILFASNIIPKRASSSLSEGEVLKVIKETKRIIALAIKHRGTTFNNYRDSRGRKGNFSSRLKVYGRGGQPCVKCRAVLIKSRVAGRGTVHCPVCQK